MTKVTPSLTILSLALGLAGASVFGCGGGGAKADGGQAGGSTGAGDGGSAGAGGAGGSGAGGEGGAPVVMWPPATCTSPINGIATVSFCMYYQQKCASQYGATPGAFANMADCQNSYPDFTANADPASTAAQNQKGCAAYHLCVAGMSSPGDPMHCRHAAGGADNPCSLPQ